MTLFIYDSTSNPVCSDETSFNITIGNQPDVDIIHNVSGTPTYPYMTNFEVNGADYSSIEWYLNDVFVSDSDPLNINLGAGFNEIMLLGIDTATGCADTAYLDLNSQDLSDFNFPNVITPNNDGVNDILRFDIDFNDVKFSIYNRWGTLVYESNNTKAGWTVSSIVGTNLSEGVYFYIIDGKLPNGDKIYIMRHITLLR